MVAGGKARAPASSDRTRGAGLPGGRSPPSQKASASKFALDDGASRAARPPKSREKMVKREGV